MKKFFLLTILSASALLTQAKIWRVNNVPGITADFTTAQLAHDNASVLAGDSIYLESSPTSYGDLTTTKRLVWISLGNFFNTNPGLQNHINSGFISNLTINGGSDGSIFQININSGCYMNSVTNITLQRCYVGSILTIGGSSNHITLTQNYFSFNNYLNISPSSTQSVFTITNNLGNVNYINITSNAYQVTFNNNTLLSGSGSFTIDNGTISNNIFYNTGYNSLYDGGYPSNVTNNLWVGTTYAAFVGTNGNLFASDPTTVFVGGTSADGKYQILNTSVAHNAGAGGVDIGAYGGANPYVTALIPNIPSIYQLTVPANATGNSLPCTVSTRANN